MNGGNFKKNKILKFGIITLSDRAYAGIYVDKSGEMAENLVAEFCKETEWQYNCVRQIIPDDAEKLKAVVNEYVNQNFDVIFTTGGTGIGTRDITPDTIKFLLTKEIPGIMELIRVKYGMLKPNALLSRGVAGVINKSFICTLPGSVKAVAEYLDEIFKLLEHLLFMLHDVDVH